VWKNVVQFLVNIFIVFSETVFFTDFDVFLISDKEIVLEKLKRTFS
jgi:hypothetical protein